MKNIGQIIIATTLFFCVACCHKPTEEDAIREMVVNLHTQYPLATLQDVYKTCYQDYFGAEHAAPDSARAMQYLLYELETMGEQTGMPDIEPCGFRHDYERVSLQNIKNGTMSAEDLLTDFLNAAQAPKTYENSWENEWEKIEQIAVECNCEWQDEELQNALREAAKDNYAVHHSAVFREQYAPHYRIRKTKQIF